LPFFFTCCLLAAFLLSFCAAMLRDDLCDMCDVSFEVALGTIAEADTNIQHLRAVFQIFGAIFLLRFFYIVDVKKSSKKSVWNNNPASVHRMWAPIFRPSNRAHPHRAVDFHAVRWPPNSAPVWPPTTSARGRPSGG